MYFLPESVCSGPTQVGTQLTFFLKWLQFTKVYGAQFPVCILCVLHIHPETRDRSFREKWTVTLAKLVGTLGAVFQVSIPMGEDRSSSLFQKDSGGKFWDTCPVLSVWPLRPGNNTVWEFWFCRRPSVHMTEHMFWYSELTAIVWGKGARTNCMADYLYLRMLQPWPRKVMVLFPGPCPWTHTEHPIG